MAKRVFFSFHYQDVLDFRANVVRNHDTTKEKGEAGFIDASIWETAKKQGDIALKRLINSELKNTSNSCILVGTNTYERPWVRYEILKSFVRGNHILAIHINGIKDKFQKTKDLGKNPLSYVGVYPTDKNTLRLIEKKAKWTYYTKIDGTDTFTFNNHGLALDKTHSLSEFYKIYKWNADKGFDNFSKWLQ